MEIVKGSLVVKHKMVSRWGILFASALCDFCIGASYAWSVFQKPLISMFSWSLSDASLAFTLHIIMMPIAMVIAGKIQDQYGPRFVLMTGGLLFGAGIIASGFTTSIGWLYLTYGVLAGLGDGTVYACAMANTVKWFPDKKGLAGGLIAASMGLGAVVWAPFGNALIQSYGVLSAFRILGIVYMVIIVCGAIFVDRPPSCYKPVGWELSDQNSSALNKSGKGEKTWREMLADPVFYILWVIYFLGTSCGLMIIGHVASIAQDILKLSAATAALLVSIMALANTCGRIFWGYMSDRFGRYPVLIALFSLLAITMLVMTNVDSFSFFALAVSVIVLCYGGLIGIYPSIAADMFGMKNLGLNYGILITGYSIAGFVGPRLAAAIKEAEGDYTRAFLIAALFGICGGILALAVFWQSKKRDSLLKGMNL
ncbi:OFA family MFS transporter [Sporomusa sp. KB1]|jgi:OFA family oxalate/formate antiporter-like MFS transporter|uniref:L-lactate MFS transporter n=1 Tax=Sporomusa sp. KB1 TaxID=943346 RepID=UPI00119D947A|nr:OFA family MFS transporter [Sporomusa sp. KB1]